MKSNAKQIEFTDLERLNLHIETLTDKATKEYITELCDGIEEMKDKNDIEPVSEYSAALYAANEQLRTICKSKHITDGQVAKSIKMSGAWFSECNLPPENKRARLPETTQRRLYNIIQGRKNALFTLFASRKRLGEMDGI
jgi:uncharacterized surface anchored protein